MSGSERMMNRARLADIKRQLEEIELRADSQIIVIRQQVDPFLDLSEMDVRRAQLAMNDLVELAEKHRDLSQKAKQLDEAING
jgi:hypothetical protein